MGKIFVRVREANGPKRLFSGVFAVCLFFTEGVQANAEWKNAIEKVVRDQALLQSQTPSVEWIDPKTDALPQCLNPRVSLPATTRPVGRLTVSLRCDSTRWIGSLQINISARRNYLASSRALPAGTVIAEEDIIASEGDWFGLPEDVTAESRLVIGKTLSKGLMSGAPITLNSLRQTSVIRSGERVRVEFVGVGFAVSGEALALDSGSIEEQIRVRMANGQVLSVRVVKRGVVELRRD